MEVECGELPCKHTWVGENNAHIYIEREDVSHESRMSPGALCGMCLREEMMKQVCVILTNLKRPHFMVNSHPSSVTCILKMT